MSPTPVRLVATDLDGTLLQPDRSVSPRTRAALAAVRAAGVLVVPVTARQPHGLQLIAEDAGFTDWALCSNSALGVHLGTGQVLFEHTLAPSVQARVAGELSDQLPQVRFAVVGDQGRTFLAQHGYPDLADFEDHKRHPADMSTGSLAQVTAVPGLKLVARHPELSVPELVERIRALAVSGMGVTHSGAPFAEILPAGLTKAVGLAHLCAHLGIEAEQVIAFGDAPNDVEMLTWAGRGVAMANAAPETIAAADEVAPANHHDGVAQVLEGLLDRR